MKLIPWHIHDDVEAYTTTKELGDISLNNPNILQVLQNRQELASLLNTDLEHMVAPRQTHSTNLKQVYLKDGGTNMFKQTDTLYEVDATYTKDKDLYLLSFHADCTPILVYCKDQGIVCAIHSGWLGTVRQIVDHTIRYLIEKENCNPKDMYCLIGPCLSKNHLEVQDDVIDQVKQMNFDTTPFYKQVDETHYLLDNKGRFAIVHRPDRMIDILNLMQKYDIEPKRIRFVYPKMNRESHVLLVEGMYKGKKGIKIESPLYAHNDDGSYSNEVRKMFGEKIDE